MHVDRKLAPFRPGDEGDDRSLKRVSAFRIAIDGVSESVEREFRSAAASGPVSPRLFAAQGEDGGSGLRIVRITEQCGGLVGNRRLRIFTDARPLLEFQIDRPGAPGPTLDIVPAFRTGPVQFDQVTGAVRIARRTDEFEVGGTREIVFEEFYKLKYCSTVVYMVPRA